MTSTAICGSDLHLYGVLGMYLAKGDVLGHEAMGIVEEVGSGVTNLSPGDRVVVPFGIACGTCWMCGHAGFRFLPGLYDVAVTPMMSRLGLSRERVAAHSGNVWVPVPAGEAVHGRWGRHWLRWLPLAAVGGACALVGARRARP